MKMNTEERKIKNLVINNYKCFKKAECSFEKADGSIYQWNVFLGNNNSGKTNLLKAIAGLRSVELVFQYGEKDNKIKGHGPAFLQDKTILSSIILSDGQLSCQVTNYNKNWGYISKGFALAQIFEMENFIIYGYGVSRYPSSKGLNDFSSDDCDTLFSRDASLINLKDWLLNLDYSSKNGQTEAGKRLTKIKEILTSDVFPEIEDFRCQSSEELQNYVEFQVKGVWCKYEDLGFGYQSMMSWMIDFCKRMFERYPKSENPLAESAIVLVDEIDLHLHPQWQRNVIPYLSKTFPNTQFFVTTHSPMVLQSAKDINLFVLKHNEEGMVSVERSDIHDFRGWTVEEILRETMGLQNDVHSDEYQRLISEFNTSLDKNDREKMQRAYDEIIPLLHPNNPLKRILEIQRNQFLADD
ncbi:MAG: AAA family ATPase [Bacteroidales bacterium]|nr:AAA family ATPase [Bacteroidales bacterium]